MNKDDQRNPPEGKNLMRPQYNGRSRIFHTGGVGTQNPGGFAKTVWKWKKLYQVGDVHL